MAPPIARPSEREIRKYTFTGPYRSHVNGSVRILDENIALDSRIEWRVTPVGISLDVHVRDQDDVEALLAQVGDHFFKMREILPIDGERGVTFLIVNIQIDGVGRNFLFAQEPRDFPHAGLGIVAIAALLVTEYPKRWQGRAPGERGVLLDDFFWSPPGNKVIIQFPAFRSERKIVRGLFPEIETAAVGVVKEQAVGHALAKSHKKRNGLVKRVGGFLPAERIRVPVGERAIPAIHGSGFVTQSVVVFL